MSTTTNAIPILARRTRTRPSRTVHRLVAVASTVVVAVVGWADIHLLGGTDLVLGSGSDARTVGAADVVVTTVVSGLAGWAALAALERVLGRGRRARRAWLGLSATVLALSLAGPLTADAPVSTQWSLVALHSSVGVAFAAAMAHDAAGAARRARPARRSGPSVAGGRWTRLRREVPR